MRLYPAYKIALAECRARALRYLSRHDYHVRASYVGAAIWPGNKMRSQGLGGAASRILRGLQKDGLAHWSSDGQRDWGWKITNAGRKALKSHDDAEESN